MFLLYLHYPNSTFSLAGSIISKLIIITILNIITHNHHHYVFSNLPLSIWISFILVPAISVIIICLIFMIDTRTNLDYLYSLSVPAALLLLFINICIFTIYEQLSKRIESEKKHIIYNQQLQKITEQIHENEISIQRFRKEYHDFKNKIIYIQKLAQEADNNAIYDYINEELSITFLFSKTTYTGNFIIDAIINLKDNVAKELGINFNKHIEIPANLPLNNDSLCIILGNALDNAIDATKLVSVEKYIDLSIYYKKECLCITIINPYSHKIKYNSAHRLRTTKQNNTWHGIGLTSIETALLKSNGSMFINTDNSIFTIKFLFYV
ncbi:MULTISPECIES: sensor histidine kinase [Blautia]|uniref:sensor histidine kinase n=1 Tax=Blautia TaxID=572511 RepID=UPI0013900465|nr:MULTISPECIES: GHKL domain-containing protein [Blautia]